METVKPKNDVECRDDECIERENAGKTLLSCADCVCREYCIMAD